MTSRFARLLFVLAAIPLVTTCRGDRFLGLIGPPAQVAVQAGNNQTATVGSTLPVSPEVVVRDARGMPIPGIEVNWSVAGGSGSVSTASSTTGSSGTTSVAWTLGVLARTDTLHVTAAGLSSSPATFTAVGIPGPVSAAVSVVSVASGSVASGSTVALTLQAKDAFGNNLTSGGATVVFTASGGTSTGTIGVTTDHSNGTYTATFTGVTAGTATTIRATVNGSAVTSTLPSVTVTSGAATHLLITTQPSVAAQGGVAFAQQPALQLADASGNAVSQSGIVVTAAIATGGGTLGGTLTASTNSSGVATFTNLAITGTVGARTLTFTATGLTSATSGTVTISAGAASQLAITTQPSTAAQSGVALAQQPVVQLEDAAGNALTQSGIVVTTAIATGGGTLGGTLTASTNSSGVATFTNLAITGTIGSRTLTFSATGVTSVASGTVTISAGAASQLAIATQPSTAAQSGVAFAQQPVLQLEDASGNAVSQSGTVVTAAIATGGGTLGGTVTASTNGSGVATFTNLAITGTAGARTLSFTATGMTGTTSGTVTISAATQLVITTQPSTAAQSGVPFVQQPVLQLEDAGGNPVSQSGIAVTASIATGGGTLGGTATATTNASGVASFTNLAITGTIGARTLSFAATGLTSATSSTITISAGAASQLAITTQPSTATQSGVAFAQQPVLQLEDASGNAVSQSGTVVTAAIATGAGTLGGTLTATSNASGVATFTNLVITGTVGARTLSFSATGVTSATSGTVTISAGAATQLVITTQPSTAAQSGVAFAQQPVLQLEDASGNAVSQSGTVVTAAIATGGGALGGTLTASTNGNGAATFTNLAITGTAGARTLSFSASGVTGATSGTVTISAATQLVITTQPSTAAQSGVAFAQQPLLQLEDAGGNPISQGGIVVTAAIATGGGALAGTATATTNTSGVATFTNLAITGTVGARTLSFSATGLTSATSGTVTISAGAASQLAITTQPSTAAQSGVAFAQQPVLQLEDAAGNAVSQSGTVVTAAIATGGATLGGTLTASTNSSGVATFANLAIAGTIGARTLTFTATGLTSATSGTVTITAGAATQLAITAQPSTVAQSGVAFAQQPVLQLQDASGNPVSQSGTVLTAAIATGGGALGGTLTATSNASGVATFANLAITGTVGARTLTFSATGLTSATSGTVTITAGAATQLAITTQPSTAAQSGVAFAQQPALQLEDASGNVVSQSGTVVTAAIATGAGTLGGTLTATSNASGVATFTNLAITGTVGARTLNFTATGLTSATSGTVTITAGAATQLVITTQPSTAAQSGVAFAQQPVLQLEDASGNAVSQSGTVVTVAITTGGGALGGTLTATSNASGVATFTNLAITGTVGARTLNFTATGVTSATSGTVTISAGAASQLAITTQPSTAAQSGVAFAQQPVLQLADASGNPVTQSGTVVTAAIATGGGTLGGTLTASTNGSGVATFTNLAITGTVGARTLTFTATGLTSATSGTVTISAGSASQLTITTQPSTAAQSGVAFAQQPALQLEDASGNPVTQSGTVVMAAIATGGGALGGTLTATSNASGVATFTNLAINGTIGARTLTFSATGLTSATSGTVTISAGAASQLAITTQPSTAAQSGVAFAQQPALQLEDASGNAVSQSGTVVTAAIATGSGALGGTLTASTNSSGVATFTNLGITGTVGARTLTFTATGLTSATSGTVTISAGVATQLAITLQPSSTAQSGVAFAQQPMLQLEDASGNAVSQSGTVVTAAIATGGGTLGGTLTASTNGSGVATFTNLSITGTIGDRTLTFTATGLTGVTSGTVTISAGAASQLAITTQPSTAAQSGVAFAQQPALQLEDASGNPVSQSGTVVTAAIATGGGALGGTLTATSNASGVATFTNLAITGTVGARTLSFTATGLTSATSGTVTISAGAASQLAITTQPSTTAQSGVAFAQQPALQLQDASGNTVSQNGVVVTAAIATGGGALGGTLTASTNSSGVATFTNLAISGTIGARTLTFSATGLTSATSGTVTISAGAASQLAITTQPSTAAQSGVAFAQQPALQLEDAAGNAVSQSGIVVTASIATGGGTLGGTLTATSNASGVATFTNLAITGTVGARTLTFSATGLTSATSGTVTISAGAASQLAITTQPSTAAQSGVAFAQQPAVQLQDAAGNAVSQSGTVVTAAIATGGGALGGTLTATTNTSGVATFTSLVITGTIGARTLTFGAPGLTSATSGTVTISAGAASHLAITTQPSAAPQSGVAFLQQPVIQLQDASGNAASQSGIVVTAAIATGGGTLGGTLTATSNGSGVAAFTNLVITGTIGARTLSFTATGLTGATSSTVTVSAGAASQMVITTQPPTAAQSGVAFIQQPVLQLLDASGNAATSGTAVTAAIATGASALVGTLTATSNASGVATFTDLAITGAIGARTLSFTATGLTGATSSTVTITAATQLVITTQPSSTARNEVAFAQQPVLQLKDAGGNPISQSGIVVTATIATGGGALGGTLTATSDASGVVTFTNLAITGTIGDRTLTFATTGLTSTTSGTITISAGTATHLVFNVQPTNTPANNTITPAVQLSALDNEGNLDTSFSGSGFSVRLQIASFGSGDGSAKLTGGDITDAVLGVVTFSGLSIDTVATGYTLIAGTVNPPPKSLTPATSNPFTITP